MSRRPPGAGGIGRLSQAILFTQGTSPGTGHALIGDGVADVDDAIATPALTPTASAREATGVAWWIKRSTLAVTGSVRVAIFDDTAGLPNAELATSASEPIAAIPTGAITRVVFNLTAPLTITGSPIHALIIRENGGHNDVQVQYSGPGGSANTEADPFPGTWLPATDQTLLLEIIAG